MVFSYGRGRTCVRPCVRRSARFARCVAYGLPRPAVPPPPPPLPPSHTPRGVAAPGRGFMFANGGRAHICRYAQGATPSRCYCAPSLRFNWWGAGLRPSPLLFCRLRACATRLQAYGLRWSGRARPLRYAPASLFALKPRAQVALGRPTFGLRGTLPLRSVWLALPLPATALSLSLPGFLVA